jgi:hypothetical protein
VNQAINFFSDIAEGFGIRNVSGNKLNIVSVKGADVTAAANQASAGMTKGGQSSDQIWADKSCCTSYEVSHDNPFILSFRAAP